MKHTLIRTVEKFLKMHGDIAKPLLLALSGGPDSLALLDLLILCQKKQPFSFAIAHVNHRWRPESDQEAKILEQLAKDVEIPFHLKTLQGKEKKNSESAARTERLQFYRELIECYGYQAVLLGHHRDDQAETVLKNLFEGAVLPSCTGIQPCAVVEGVPLWRPLLDISKKDLVAWCGERGLNPFEDSTNQDPSYLRGKMRQKIFPCLSEMFGKNIVDPLASHAEEAQELKAFLLKSCALLFSQIYKGPFGSYCDLSETFPIQPYLLKFFIREFSRQQNLSLSKSVVEEVASALMQCAVNKKFMFKEKVLIVDRARLFCVKAAALRKGEEFLPIELGAKWGCWKVVEVKKESEETFPLWKEAWNGVLLFSLPDDGMYVMGERSLEPFEKRWAQVGVPVFLRHAIPVIWFEERPYLELLSGRKCPGNVVVKCQYQPADSG